MANNMIPEHFHRVVYIEARGDKWKNKQGGSGVLLRCFHKDAPEKTCDIVITCRHVVTQNEEEVREAKIWPYDVGFDPGEAKGARINKERLDKAPSDAQDLIILEPQETWRVAGLTSCCDTASINEEITVVGYALGPYRIGTLNNHRVIPAPYHGHIGACNNNGFYSFIGANTAHGVSGGAVFNKKQELVGIWQGKWGPNVTYSEGVIIGSYWIKELCERAGYRLAPQAVNPHPEETFPNILRLFLSIENGVIIGHIESSHATVALPNSASYNHAFWRLAQDSAGALRSPTATAVTAMTMLEAQNTVGSALYQALFPGELEKILLKFLGDCHDRKVCAVLQVISDKHELLGFPFELMHHPVHGFFCLQGLVIVRVPYDVLDKKGPDPGSPPLDVLMMVANPEMTGSLDYENEQKVLIEAFDQRLHPKSQIPSQLYFVEDGTPEALAERVRELAPQVVHLSMHGTREGTVVLEDGQGNKKEVDSKTLATKMTDSKELRLVVLSACYSGEMLSSGLCAGLLQNGIPLALGMQRSILDSAATVFAGEFYRALAQGESVPEAIYLGRKVLQEKSKDDISISEQWWIPTLYS